MNESLLYASCPTRRTPVNYPELIAAVEAWAEARHIFRHSKPMPQLMKTVSEIGELCDATLKDNRSEVIDAVGDVLVTLIIYCRLQGLTLQECLSSSYEVIKDRKGTLTPEGVFVKE